MGDTKLKKIPRLTIVGGQPRNHQIPGSEDVKVPVGFEALLLKAAQDKSFKAELLSDREVAIDRAGVELRPSEWATLRAVSSRAPEEELYRERCLKLGENVARKAIELFGKEGQDYQDGQDFC